MTAARFDMPWPALLLLWPLTTIVVWLVWRALRAGRVRMRGGGYITRAREPAQYWFTMGLGGFIVAVLMMVMLGATGRLLRFF